MLSTKILNECFSELFLAILDREKRNKNRKGGRVKFLKYLKKKCDASLYLRQTITFLVEGQRMYFESISHWESFINDLEDIIFD